MGLLHDDIRLYQEASVMRERWGEAPRLSYDKDKKLLYWELTVEVEGRRFPTRIEYPDEYPYVPPVLRSLVDLDPACPHLLDENTLCWINPDQRLRTRAAWEPGRDTAAMVVTVAHVWWRAYLIWEATCKWPEVYDDEV